MVKKVKTERCDSCPRRRVLSSVRAAVLLDQTDAIGRHRIGPLFLFNGALTRRLIKAHNLG